MDEKRKRMEWHGVSEWIMAPSSDRPALSICARACVSLLSLFLSHTVGRRTFSPNCAVYEYCRKLTCLTDSGAVVFSTVMELSELPYPVVSERYTETKSKVCV